MLSWLLEASCSPLDPIITLLDLPRALNAIIPRIAILHVCCFKVSDIERAIKSAGALFKEYSKFKAPTAPWPLLVIDEANFMEGWSSTAERDTILAFLVDVSVFKASV